VPTPDTRLLVRLRAFERARVCCMRYSLLACRFVGPPVPRSLARSSAPPRRRLCATIKDHTLTQGCGQLKLAAQRTGLVQVQHTLRLLERWQRLLRGVQRRNTPVWKGRC